MLCQLLFAEIHALSTGFTRRKTGGASVRVQPRCTSCPVAPEAPVLRALDHHYQYVRVLAMNSCMYSYRKESLVEQITARLTRHIWIMPCFVGLYPNPERLQ